jgi:hypothetical protein
MLELIEEVWLASSALGQIMSVREEHYHDPHRTHEKLYEESLSSFGSSCEFLAVFR